MVDTEFLQLFRGKEHSTLLSGEFCIGFLSLNMFRILDNGTPECDTSHGMLTHKLRDPETVSVGGVIF